MHIDIDLRDKKIYYLSYELFYLLNEIDKNKDELFSKLFEFHIDSYTDEDCSCISNY